MGHVRYSKGEKMKNQKHEKKSKKLNHIGSYPQVKKWTHHLETDTDRVGVSDFERFLRKSIFGIRVRSTYRIIAQTHRDTCEVVFKPSWKKMAHF